jgi:quinoprotein glucose dehydrogenase
MGYDLSVHLAILNSMNVSSYVRLFPSADFARLKKQGVAPGTELARQTGAPFGMERAVILSPLDVPCNRPLWGVISTVDLDTGKLRWQHPFGAVPVGLLGLRAPASWGAPNIGGRLITASGLIFIGASSDGMFRAIDGWTGEVVWEHPLPDPGAATPMSFQAADGRQFVVFAGGGSILLKSPIGDALVAIARAAK